MREEAEQHVEALRQLVTLAIGQATGDDVEEAREKHEGIARSVAELERLAVDVPAALTTLLEQYAARVAVAREAHETLTYVRESLRVLADRAGAAVAMAAPTVEGGRRRERAESVAPRGFVLEGTQYAATSWTELLREVLRVLAARHPDDFDRVLELRNNRGRPLFSRDQSELDRPLAIDGTDLYVWGRVGSERATNIVERAADLFGYGPTKFAVLEPE
ncbi:MAG: hypothetical protein IT305_12530 [Chloroflexi bacterium]|nr:hypothetical protein [Chloroflexota bacterium]